MTDDGTRRDDASAAWFEGVAPDDAAAGAARIREGRADAPDDWPGRAVEAGFADDEADYYAALRDAAVRAAREAASERERADDQQLVHAVRAMDDATEQANELAERVAEWAGSRYPDAGTGVDYARELAEREPASSGDSASSADRESESPTDHEPESSANRDFASSAEPEFASPADERLVALARRTADLADEADRLRAFIERETPEVAPNLAALAGPTLAARLISLAGGLEPLAKKPAGTVQVLGAEDALFAHLRGRGSSPKHGVIFTHEYVRGTRPEKRGSAARAFAGKLAIAARIDHYAGDRRPDLDEELRARIERIRGSGGDAA